MTSTGTSDSVYGRSEALRSSLLFNTAALRSELATGMQDAVGTFRSSFLRNVAGLSAAASAAMTAVEKSVSVTTQPRHYNSPKDYIRMIEAPSVGQASKHEIQEELLAYLDLRDGWDGEGSLAPSESKIGDAHSFLDGLPDVFKLPEPTVYNDGEVGYYWQNGDNILSITFFGDGKKAYYGKVRNREYRSDTKQTFSAIDQDLLIAIASI